MARGDKGPRNLQSVSGLEAVSLASTDYTPTVPTEAVYIGGAGSSNLKVDTADGDSGITLAGLLAGTWLWIRVTKIYKTGTDVTNIVAGF